MKEYNFEKIDKMVQPLMEMMQKEYPNDAVLIIEPYFARIEYRHGELIFKSDSIPETGLFGNFLGDFADALERHREHITHKEEQEEKGGQ